MNDFYMSSLKSNTFVLRNYFFLRYTLVLIIPLLATVAVIWKFFLVVQVPFRLDYAEGFIFSNTLSVIHGLPIYHSVESTPYVFGFYTPLFNYLGAILFKLFDVDISILRSFSFGLYLATGALVGFIIKKVTKSIFAAVVAGLLFCSAFIIAQWSSVARPDMLGLFFISIGVALVVVSQTKKISKLMLAALFFSLAFFAKQHFIFAPLACFIFLLFENKKQAWSFSGAYLLFVGIGIALLHLNTSGEFTKQIFMYTGLVPYHNLSTALRILVITGISAFPLIIIAIRQLFRNPKNFFSIYFLCSLMTFFMLLRDGGIQNYLLEFVLALTLLAATAIQWSQLLIIPARRLYPYLAVMNIFFILWSFTSFPWETKSFVENRLEVFKQEISTIGKNAKLLAEDPLVAYATNSTIELDPYTFGQVSDAGLLSSVVLFSDIQKGAYTYIVDYGAFSRISGIAEVIRKNFDSVVYLKYAHPTKPFDYSLYNRNTFLDIGILYRYRSGVNSATSHQ